MGGKKGDALLTDLLNLKVTNNRFFSIPFVRGIVQEGHYIAHPEEPSIYGSAPNSISLYWVSWLQHMLVRGEQGVEDFQEVTSGALFPPEIKRVAHAAFLILNSELAAKEVVIGKEPPSIMTANRRYISQKWVIDTCRRDDMQPFEAVNLAQALLRC